MKDFSMIKELYLRRRGTCEQATITEEQRKTLDVTIAADKKFKEKYSNDTEIMELYNNRFDAEALYLSICEDDSYVDGFRIGVLVGLDVAKVFSDDDSC